MLRLIEIKNKPHLPYGIAFVFFGTAIWIYGYLAFSYEKNIWFSYALAYIAPGLLFLSTYRRSIWSRVIVDNPWMRWIGRNSYAIYLWHIPLIHFFSYLWLKNGMKDVGIYLTGYSAAAIAAGWISTITVERFFLRLRDQVVA